MRYKNQIYPLFLTFVRGSQCIDAAGAERHILDSCGNVEYARVRAWRGDCCCTFLMCLKARHRYGVKRGAVAIVPFFVVLIIETFVLCSWYTYPNEVTLKVPGWMIRIPFEGVLA